MRGLETRFIVLLIIALVVLAISLYMIFVGGKGPLDQVIASGKLRLCCESMSLNNYASATPCGGDNTAGQLAEAAGLGTDVTSSKLEQFCTGGA